MKVSTFFFKLSPVVVLMASMGSAVADNAMDWDKMAGSNIESEIGTNMDTDFKGMTDMTTDDESSRMSENVSDEDLQNDGVNIVSDSEKGMRQKMTRESRDIGMAGGPNVDITKGSETEASNMDSTRGLGKFRGYTLEGERKRLD